jgi:hypothetical protein
MVELYATNLKVVRYLSTNVYGMLLEFWGLIALWKCSRRSVAYVHRSASEILIKNPQMFM